MLPQKDSSERARAYLLRLLAHRPRSRAEAQERLQQKGFSKDVITTVLHEAEQKGWLNDRLFARLWIEDRVARHPKSRHALARELAARGLDPELIEDALARAAIDETALAEALVRQRLSRYRHLTPQERQRRLVGLLQRRGFPPRVIQRALQPLGESVDYDDGI
ncbi:MAG: regulatory protein RecX [Candidatus Bipolaricaulota bacterium]|nr:recombination regulator RecX [Candidatus Bipolaricaulota bacterium]MDW8110607.1 regulatory protein RecX [Candidatus Bipolaricaulota bacterium]MDW8329776.1 regulatory protein RecX [Candidatus Bipolaricaulota bacterium]